MRYILVALVCLAAALLAGGAAAQAEKPNLQAKNHAAAFDPPKHVVIILADTLRYDYVAASGVGRRVSTPYIDSVAKTGLFFKNAFTVSPISAPSYASLWSGEMPFEHGVTNNAMKIASRFNRLPVMMQKAGFHTASFVANYYCGKRFGFARGWDTLYDRDVLGAFSWEVNEVLLPWLQQWNPEDTPLFLFVAYMDPHVPYAPPWAPKWMQVKLDNLPVGLPRSPDLEEMQRVWITVPPGQHKLDLERVLPPIRPNWKPRYTISPYHWQGIMKDGVALEFVANVGEPIRNDKSNVVTWPARDWPVEAMLTNPTEKPISGELVLRFKRLYYAEDARELYPVCVEFMDHEIGRVLQVLKDKKVFNDTLVIFLSDHGEGLGDHDLVGHLEQVYDSLLHVPLIMRYPPLGKGRLDEMASIIDILPTLAALYGLPAPVESYGQPLLSPLRADGHSLRPWVFGETSPPEAAHRLTALRYPEWKLIVNETVKKAEYYNLVQDPKELSDLFSESSATSVEAAKRYRDLFKIEGLFDPITEAEQLNLDDLPQDELTALEALGYL